MVTDDRITAQPSACSLQKGHFACFILTRTSWLGVGQRKEQMDGISSID